MGWTSPKTMGAEAGVSTDWNTYVRDNENFLKLNVALGVPALLTVAGGIVTKTQSYHEIAGEGGVADSIDTINGGTEGDLLLLKPVGAYAITLKDGTGNLDLFGDVVLRSSSDHMIMVYDGTNWLPLRREPRGYGGMYLHENVTALTIEKVSLPHAIHGYTEGHLAANWTFFAGKSVTITAYATSDAGAKTLVSSEATGLTNGDIVTIANTTSYDGIWVIEQVVASTSFVIATAFVANDGASVGHAAGYLTSTDLSATGVYLVNITMNPTPATNNDAFEFEVYLDATEQLATEVQIKLGAAGTDFSVAHSQGIIEYTAGQKVWCKVENVTGAGDLTIRNANITVTRVQ